MTSIVLLGVTGATLVTWAGAASSQVAEVAGAWSVLESDFLVLFRILVVATVIERLLEVLSLLWQPVSDLVRRWFPRKGEQPELQQDLAKIRKQLVLQGIGVVLGIAICWRAELGIFAQLQGVARGHLGELVMGWLTSHAGGVLDYVVTGFLVGLGTEPVHSIITIILRRRDLRRLRKAPVG